MSKIVSIHVQRMYETCQRTTFYVTLTNEEGFTINPASYRTGSVYNNFEGLSADEALDRALIDANQWGDFLQIPVTPYEDAGVEIKPTMTFGSYTMRREIGHE